MIKTTSTPTRFIFFSLAFLALFAALAALSPDLALASDDFGMGGPFETVKNVITGKWGKMISIAGMACCGIVFAVTIVDALFSFSSAII